MLYLHDKPPTSDATVNKVTAGNVYCSDFPAAARKVQENMKPCYLFTVSYYTAHTRFTIMGKTNL